MKTPVPQEDKKEKKEKKEKKGLFNQVKNMGKDFIGSKNPINKIVPENFSVDCYRKYVERKLSTESGTITLRFIKAKNLVSADSNGLR